MPRQKRRPSTLRNPARPPGGKRRPEADIIRMVNACEEAMLLRMSRDNIYRMLSEIMKEDIPPRTCDQVIRRVKDRWEAEETQTRPEMKKQAVRRNFSHIRRAVQKGNLAAVARHEKILGDIQGVFAPVKIEASTPPGQPIEVSIRDPRKMTSAERRKRLAELEAKRQVTLAAVVAVKPAT